uniref:Cytochrome c oxidase subunit 2 n=1 Tax=Oreohelix idahoensis TaxID=2584915 RepID=A0A4Y5P314_9EUPU|nr:cytochrome c oxidase subunit II [Oreohelix idahoensis]QCW57651.1 cytochrome c oxidase subunit 2 [Oreohelix idahoensis]UKG20813.1 cytochrome c oxidase subunit 2 [Oreohelix idahoensis]
MSFWNQYNLIDPASPIQAQMTLFHDHALILLIGIFVLVAILGAKLIFNKLSSRYMYEAQTLEVVWTIMPAFFLVWLAIPSLRLLYLTDEQPLVGNVTKAIGHQWYWSYEAGNLNNEMNDSYMKSTDSLTLGDYRLLEADYHSVIPALMDNQIIVTSTDVIHSFAVPSLGVKVDAVPGRLNILNIFPSVTGVFYGQCSEICGANHSFMPIVVEAIPLEDYVNLSL